MKQSMKEFGWQDVVAIWNEIRIMARWLLSKECRQYSWRPTSLAVEALKRLHQQQDQWVEVKWNNKKHFINSCLKAMKSALIDRHRFAGAARRVSNDCTESIESIGVLNPEQIISNHLDVFICFQQAVDRIAKTEPLLAKVLEVRFICGYSAAEAAELLDYSERHMRRLFAVAKVSLDRILQDPA